MLNFIYFQVLSSHEYDIFQKIVKQEYTISEELDLNAKELIEKLIIKDPSQRLGASNQNDYSALKAHQFFKNINWNNLLDLKVPN